MDTTAHKAILAALTAAALLATSATAAVAQSFYTSGHADIGLGEGGELEPHLHLDAGAVVDGVALTDDDEYDPATLTIVVGKSGYDFIAAVGGRPPGSAYSPIGVAAGVPFWFLPEANTGAGGAGALGLPWLGIGGEEITKGVFAGNEIKLTLVGATAPAGATFSMWTTGFSGPIFAMSTLDGISDSDSITIDLDTGDHIHANYAFTLQGTYALEFQVSAEKDGEPVFANATYTFAVVPEPSTYAALLGLGMLAVATLRRKRSLVLS